MIHFNHIYIEKSGKWKPVMDVIDHNVSRTGYFTQIQSQLLYFVEFAHFRCSTQVLTLKCNKDIQIQVQCWVFLFFNNSV